MPPRPVPRPHFTSLGFTWLPLCASHRLALRLLVLPPSCRAPPHAFSHPTASLAPSSLSTLTVHARARARKSPASRPPSCSHAPSFLFLLSTAASSPSLSAAPFARLDLTLLFPPRTLVLLLPTPCSSSSAPTEHSHRPFVYEGMERLSVSSRLVSLDSLSHFSLSLSLSLSSRFTAPSSSSFLFLSACSPSAVSSSFVPYSTLSPLPPLHPLDSSSPSRCSTPCSCARRGINYSKNLYCYYYRLTIPSALVPEMCTRAQYNARLCSRPADYVNSTTAKATTATTGRRCLVPFW